MGLKDSTYRTLVKYYKQTKDINRLVTVAQKMLESKNSDPIIRGEICESVLVSMLEDYIEKNNLADKGWFIDKGLILKDMHNVDSEYLTELDVTLFTPKQIYLFECKSYKGTKVAREKCSLYIRTRANGKDKEKRMIDVYSQHIKHYKALLKCLAPFMINVNSKSKPFRLVCFDFSEGELIDERTDRDKRIFPILNETNLYSLFNGYNKKAVQWDITSVRKLVNRLDDCKESLTRKHLSYVTSLHHDDGFKRKSNTTRHK